MPEAIGVHLLQTLGLVGSGRHSAVARLDPEGRLTDIDLADGDDDLVARIGTGPGVLAIDAPLAVPDETGQRDVERVLAWCDVPAFPVSRRRLEQLHGGARGVALAPRRGRGRARGARGPARPGPAPDRVGARPSPGLAAARPGRVPGGVARPAGPGVPPQGRGPGPGGRAPAGVAPAGGGDRPRRMGAGRRRRRLARSWTTPPGSTRSAAPTPPSAWRIRRPRCPSGRRSGGGSPSRWIPR